MIRMRIARREIMPLCAFPLSAADTSVHIVGVWTTLRSRISVLHSVMTGAIVLMRSQDPSKSRPLRRDTRLQLLPLPRRGKRKHTAGQNVDTRKCHGTVRQRGKRFADVESATKLCRTARLRSNFQSGAKYLAGDPDWRPGIVNCCAQKKEEGMFSQWRGLHALQTGSASTYPPFQLSRIWRGCNPPPAAAKSQSRGGTEVSAARHTP